MTKREWKERQRQDEALARLGIGKRDAGRLRKIEATLHRLAEEHCNRELSPAEERKIETREETARRIVAEAWKAKIDGEYPPAAHSTEILKAAGMIEAPPVVYFQSDPRGCALYVIPPHEVERWRGMGYTDPAQFYSSGIAVYS